MYEDVIDDKEGFVSSSYGVAHGLNCDPCHRGKSLRTIEKLQTLDTGFF